MQLRDFVTNIGGEPWKKYVLGNHTVAENIVSWSAKSAAGKSFTRILSWGLAMVAVANKEEPRVLFFLDERILAKFLADLGGTEMLNLEAMGMGLAQFSKPGEKPQLAVYLVNEVQPKQLHTFDPATPAEDQKLVFLGAIELHQDGFIFADSSECSPTAMPAMASPKPEERKEAPAPREESESREVTCSGEMSTEEVERLADRWDAGVARRRSV